MDLVITKQQRREQQEAIIDNGRDTFLGVGRALLILRDEKLYEPDYDSFKAYCEARHSFTRKTAYEYMCAATIFASLSLESDTRLTIDALQELGKIEDRDERAVAYQAASQIAGTKQIKTAYIRAVSTVLDDAKITDGHVDRGNGYESIMTAGNVVEAVIQTISDTKARQLDHIRGNTKNKELVKETCTLQQACAKLAELALMQGDQVVVKLLVYQLAVQS